MTGSAAERFSVQPPARLLVVGASGCLAGFVVAALQAAGYRLRGFDRVPLPADRVVDEFVVGDMTYQEDVRQAVAGQDGVILLAGLVRGRRDEPLQRFADVMVRRTWLVLDAAAEAGVRRVVSISSIVAIGAPPMGEDALLTEVRAPRMGGMDLYYQLSKWLGEELGRASASARGVSVVSLRPGVIAGDGSNAGQIPPHSRPTESAVDFECIRSLQRRWEPAVG